jgi:uncharacterized damage-inducible protein DinB
MADKSSTFAAHYRMFGRYNAWAKGRVFAAAGDLSAGQYRADRGAFFKSPQEFEQQLAGALAHWFNHQTHHRGQVHALLTALTGEAPELDLLYFQRLAAMKSA